MTTSSDAITAVAPDSVHAAQTEHARFLDFCEGLGVAPETDAVLLYLTALLREQQLNGARLRRRLRLLDAAFILDGRPAPSRDRHLLAYLRGLHQEAALGPVDDRTPLYREDLVAMLDAIAADSTRQLRDVALLYLANATGITAHALRYLTWHDVRIRHDNLSVRVPSDGRRNGPVGQLQLETLEHPAAVAALRALRRAIGPQPGPVFAVSGEHPPALSTLKPVLDLLPARQGTWSWAAARPEPEAHLAGRARQLRELRPRQRRDSALLTLGFHACLESKEALALRRHHIRKVKSGLLIDVPGRVLPTAIPAGGRRYDTCRLWQDWDAELERLGRPEDGWAFPAIVNEVVMSTGNSVSDKQLSQIVRTWSDAARLQGPHTFASLRMGFMRTAAREGVPEYMILNQAGLAVLKSVELHVRREHLIRHSVVNLLGL